jgi:acetyltransferase
MGQQFCAIDYGQSMAIVAEVSVARIPTLVGVARLVTTRSHRSAEYAVLVEDAWQSRGIGTLLTSYCLEICKRWGISEVIAETTVDNLRMQRILLNNGFALEKSDKNDLLYRRQVDSLNALSPSDSDKRG